jgi:hypothetical protein
MAKFVEVYSKKTGKKQLVPEHFAKNPVLMRPFSLTPKQRAADEGSPPPPPPPDKSPDASTPAASATPHRTTDTPAAGDKE